MDANVPAARNKERMEAMIQSQLTKTLPHYLATTDHILNQSADGSLPLLSASALNGLCRKLASDLDNLPCGRIPLGKAARPEGPVRKEEAAPINGELMRSKYCIRYELGICPVHQGAADSGPLFLMNNGRRFALGFDCRHCEMTVKTA
jgi:putative protease